MTKHRPLIVVVGGGTGTHTVLKGLKQYAEQIDITAIVTMADSGGSTGRLRDEFGQLPVGDVRMALTALAADYDDHDELVRELFLYRFAKGEGLNGHNFGNLLLTALTDILGSEAEAVRAASRILRVRGTVLPVTTDHVHLQAEYDDGEEVVGEHEIDAPPVHRHERRIQTLSITPHARISAEAAAALAAADLVVFGPGDLYSSVLANVVVEGFVEVLPAAPSKLLYVSNLMSRPGQTVGMHAREHIAEMEHYLKRSLDVALVHTAPFDAGLLASYYAEGNHPIEDNCTDETCSIRRGNFASQERHETPAGDTITRSLVRHDADKLASAIMEEL